jgi:hypothetical protein
MAKEINKVHTHLAEAATQVLQTGQPTTIALRRGEQPTTTVDIAHIPVQVKDDKLVGGNSVLVVSTADGQIEAAPQEGQIIVHGLTQEMLDTRDGQLDK